MVTNSDGVLVTSIDSVNALVQYEALTPLSIEDIKVETDNHTKLQTVLHTYDEKHTATILELFKGSTSDKYPNDGHVVAAVFSTRDKVPAYKLVRQCEGTINTDAATGHQTFSRGPANTHSLTALEFHRLLVHLDAKDDLDYMLGRKVCIIPLNIFPVYPRNMLLFSVLTTAGSYGHRLSCASRYCCGISIKPTYNS